MQRVRIAPFIVVAAFAPSAFAQVTFSRIDVVVGPQGPPIVSYTAGVNASGEVFGTVANSSGTSFSAYRWANGPSNWLACSDFACIARASNDNADVVGIAFDPFTGVRSPSVRWRNGLLSLLANPPGSQAAEVNGVSNSGVAVGSVRVGGQERACAWDASNAPSLLTLPFGAANSSAYFVRDDGAILGVVSNDTGVCVWSNGQPQVVYAGAQTHFPAALLPNGEIFASRTNDNVNYEALSIVGGVATVLPGMGGGHTLVTEAHPDGWAVGQATLASGQPRAMQWMNGAVFELSTLVAGGTSGWVLERATAISSNGYVCGNGTFNGQRVGFVLTPTCVATNYCTSSVASNGCQPAISSTGAASATASSGFTLSCASVEGARNGLIYYGAAQANVAWAAGSSSWLCVAAPIQRMSLLTSGGTPGACDGVLSLDWNAWRFAHPGALGSPFAVGQVFHAQAWFRDPPAPKQSNLSDALTFSVCP